MAGKANKKPIFDPLPSDLVQVDRNKYKSEVWQFFAIHKQLLDEPWVVCTKCNEWVSRHGNTTSTITDQGANFLAAVRLLIEEGVCEEQVRCSCHKLQLSINNSLEVSDLYMQIVQFNMYLSLSTGTAQSTGCCSCHSV